MGTKRLKTEVAMPRLPIICSVFRFGTPHMVPQDLVSGLPGGHGESSFNKCLGANLARFPMPNYHYLPTYKQLISVSYLL